MKGYDAGQFNSDWEYKEAKRQERANDRNKRDQRRNPRGRGITAKTSEE